MRRVELDGRDGERDQRLLAYHRHLQAGCAAVILPSHVQYTIATLSIYTCKSKLLDKQPSVSDAARPVPQDTSPPSLLRHFLKRPCFLLSLLGNQQPLWVSQRAHAIEPSAGRPTVGLFSRGPKP